MNSLKELGRDILSKPQLSLDVGAVLMAISTGLMLGNGASRKEGIFSLNRHLSRRSITNPLDSVQGGSDLGSKIITAATAKATEVVSVVNKVLPEIKFGSVYGCWKIADQETCLRNTMFFYAATFGAVCLVLASIGSHAEQDDSRKGSPYRTVSLILRALGWAFSSVCLVFAVGTYYGVAKPLQSQFGGDVDRGLAYILSITNFVASLVVLIYDAIQYGRRQNAQI